MTLLLFDCDGTIADSQNAIVTAMDQAFEVNGLTPPGRARTLAIVGLSLPQAMAALAPAATVEVQVRLAEAYRAEAQAIRLKTAEDPLFPGAAEAIRHLGARNDVVLGLATGKSMRGVRRLLADHGWENLFATLQTADDNPSKPHPAMIERAIQETGADASRTIMIGDTTFDMDMARSAGVRAVGVAWGYHPVQDLRAAGAEAIVEDFTDLLRHLGL